MSEASEVSRKYIVGWLTCRPGRRDELVELLGPYVAACRQEEGCRFFEMTPSIHDPDMVVLVECFESREAHAAHLERPVFRDFWARLPEFCLEGRFENVLSSEVEPDRAEFAATG